MKKFFIITGGLFFIGICVTVFLWFKVRDAKISYNKITVSVVSVEKIMPKDARETMKYRVKVRYDGTDRELNNVKKGFSYFAGQQVEVFESDGVLYEDEDGVRTSTMTFYYYLTSLGMTVVLLILFISGRTFTKRRETW